MKDSTRFHFMNGALLAVVLSIAVFDRRSAVQLAALTGVTWLATLLIIPRLLYSKPFARWRTELERVAKLSKYVGLWTFGWLVLHASLATLSYYGMPTDVVAFITYFETSRPIILAAASITILLLLAAISNQWSYSHLKWWKHLNILIWAVPLMALTHSLLAAAAFRGELPLLFIAPVLLAASAVAGATLLLNPHKKKMDYLRLTWLMAGGMLALAVIWLWPQ